MHLRCAWKGITGLGPSKTQREDRVVRSLWVVDQESASVQAKSPLPTSYGYLSSARLKAYAGSWGSNLLKWRTRQRLALEGHTALYSVLVILKEV